MGAWNAYELLRRFATHWRKALQGASTSGVSVTREARKLGGTKLGRRTRECFMCLQPWRAWFDVHMA